MAAGVRHPWVQGPDSTVRWSPRPHAAAAFRPCDEDWLAATCKGARRPWWLRLPGCVSRHRRRDLSSLSRKSEARVPSSCSTPPTPPSSRPLLSASGSLEKPDLGSKSVMRVEDKIEWGSGWKRRWGSGARLEVSLGLGCEGESKSNPGSKGRFKSSAPLLVVGKEPSFSPRCSGSPGPRAGRPPKHPATPVGSPAGPTVLRSRPPKPPWCKEWNGHSPQEEERP